MPTTTNFGWTTPADTDLVKDGAAAIRTLGNGIDTSLVDLKGGTTGQILSKASNTDLDYTWITNDVGDITAVTAGTGISGGGTSGAVTITNDMATTITASGDIVVGTGSGTYDNLPIGTTGQILTADTTVSPYKVKWASPAAAGFVGVGLSMTAQNQSITNQTYTALTFGAGSEEWDTDGFHDTSTNTSRITIPTGKGGKYAINGLVFFNSVVTTGIILAIYKNGSILPGNTRGYLSYVQAANSEYASGGTTINLVAGDYIELYVYANSNQNEVVTDKVFIATYLGA